MGKEAKEGQQEGDDEIKLNGVGEKEVEKSRQSERKKSVGAGDNIKLKKICTNGTGWKMKKKQAKGGRVKMT